MKTTFAFLTHPVKLHQVKSLWPFTRLLPQSFVKSFLKNESIKIIPLKRLKDRRGNEIEGCLLVSAVHPEEIRKQDDEFIFNKIIEAGALSAQMGFKILGLGGYYSCLADRKSMLYKHMKIPVTTGSAFTAWCVFEGVFKACRKRRIDLKKQTVTILAPSSTLGTLCARKLADHCGRMILSQDRTGRLEKTRQAIQAGTQTPVDIQNDPVAAVRSASVIIDADLLDPQVDMRQVPTGSIVCGVSVFESILQKLPERPDVTVIDGNAVTPPFSGAAGVFAGFENTVCAQLAETILLAYRENFVNYSLGNNVNPDKVEYMADIASHHGFEMLLPGSEIN